MWKRETWHECADELGEVCLNFRQAYWGRRSKSWPRHPGDEAEMRECSIEGVKLLRALALAVRSEQDFDLASNPINVVGALRKENALPADADEVKQGRGYQSMLGKDDYVPLTLRQALNKIAHADPKAADYYIGPRAGRLAGSHRNHDLLLFGEDSGQKWFAAVSLLELIKAIRSLPDANIVS
jgi:hypothetical protein